MQNRPLQDSQKQNTVSSVKSDPTDTRYFGAFSVLSAIASIALFKTTYDQYCELQATKTEHNFYYDEELPATLVSVGTLSLAGCLPLVKYVADRVSETSLYKNSVATLFRHFTDGATKDNHDQDVKLTRRVGFTS